MKRCPLWVKSRQVQRKSRCLLSGHQPYLRRRVGSFILSSTSISTFPSNGFESSQKQRPCRVRVMSALGQKQTCAAHKPMSALCQKQTSRQIYSITSFARSRNGYGKRRIQTATLPWSSFSSYRLQRPSSFCCWSRLTASASWRVARSPPAARRCAP